MKKLMTQPTRNGTALAGLTLGFVCGLLLVCTVRPALAGDWKFVRLEGPSELSQALNGTSKKHKDDDPASSYNDVLMRSRSGKTTAQSPPMRVAPRSGPCMFPL